MGRLYVDSATSGSNDVALSTTQKVSIARFLSRTTLLMRRLVGQGAEAVVVRRGINWALDLREGIDLAIYLLGGFEVATLRMYERYVRPGDVVFDIGANIGSHTLPLARLVGPVGRVHAFEPTAFAYGKLLRNLALNRDLAGRVDARQLMAVGSDAEAIPDSIHSSWPLDQVDGLDEGHCGRLMGTVGARKATLDQYVVEHAISRIDFMKIDVDGNEHNVLAGAPEMLARFGPTIMIELAPYVYRQRPAEFDAFVDLLLATGYRFQAAANDRLLPASAAGIRAAISDGAGLNALAICSRG